LDERGFGGFTVDEVARRSGVSKATIYKHWSGGYAVAVDAYGVFVTEPVPVVPTGDALHDLTDQVRRLARFYASPRGRVVAQLLAAGAFHDGGPALLREHFFAGRRDGTVAPIERGKADGQLRPELDDDLTVDLLFAPIVFRLFNGQRALDDVGAEGLARLALQAIAADPAEPRTPAGGDRPGRRERTRRGRPLTPAGRVRRPAGETEVVTDVWDLLVVGGGPAGSAAALGAVRAHPGARVLLLDSQAFPRDKTCGDGIAAEVVDEAVEMGVRDLADGYPAVPRLSVASPDGSVAVADLPRPTHVVPRFVFDARLVDAAREAGVEVRRERVRTVVADADGVSVNGHRARVVVGADGVHSVVRRAAGIGGNPDDCTGIAVRGYAPVIPGQEQVQVLRLEARGWPAYAWSFPIGDGRANVGFGAQLDRLPTGEPRYLHRRLAELLPGSGDACEPGSLRAAHLPLSTHRPRQPDGRVLLAGDAASLVNPLTGEGIWYAVVSGRLAGMIAVTRDPARAGAVYRKLLRARFGAHLVTTTALGRTAADRPGLLDRAVRVVRDDRDAFDQVARVGLSGGLLSPRLALRLARASLR